MFLPNLDCVVKQSSGNTDVYGQPLPSTQVKERCAIVKLLEQDMKSSIRADSSASRGNAHEMEDDAIILLTKTTKANINDVLVVVGQELKITAKIPRYDVQGNLDHYQISGMIWSLS